MAVDMGVTPGPVAAAGATPGEPGAGGPGGAGVVGGPSGIGGAGVPPPGAELTGAAPPEPPPETPLPLAAPPEDAPPAGGTAAAAWLVGAGAGAGEVAGADDASGGWLVIGWNGAVVLAALVVSAGVAVAFGLPAPVDAGVFGEVGVLGLDEPDVDGVEDALERLEEGPDELVGLVGDEGEPEGALGLMPPGPADEPAPGPGGSEAAVGGPPGGSGVPCAGSRS
ncbi:MAG: hypothetical protein U1D00_08525 [Mycobacterium sp.]|nr:hypothetical protein [Mycobacterium sp.]